MLLPARIHRLEELAHNIWWSWSPEARDVFRSISVRLWRSTDHNPVRILHEVTPDRLERLAADPDFLERYDALLELFDRLFSLPRNAVSPSIAYFSAEYGLHESLPIYSGGLGILSGDQAKTASDMAFDFIAIGFMYPRGYFEQHISTDGQQIAEYPEIDIPNVAIEQALDSSGTPILISLPMQRPDDLLHLQVWLVRCGRVKMYLMDSNIEINDPANRDITTRLYGGDREYRLRQEIALGIGGIRVLRALHVQPDVFHANEGHVAFTFVERLREAIQAGLSREDALQSVRNSSAFTTHTPVPAGHDAFDDDLIARYFWHFWPELGMSKEEFFALGEHDGMFNMTALSLNLSSRCNAVSKKHGEVTAAMWPEYVGKEERASLRSITNGVHIRTWLAPEMESLFASHLGTEWIRHLDDPGFWEQFRSVADETFWHTRLRMKTSLFSFVADRVRRKWLTGDHIFSEAGNSIIAEGVLLDPSIFTIGFARRFATYKRATLIFKDLDRLKRLVNDPLRPIQIVFSGKAHPADGGGQELIKEIWHHALDPAFGGRIAFIENYSMHTAKYLVRGCDLWMNNPKPPLEASGTSGMKAAINGAPNFSVLDGWWMEALSSVDRNGISIPNGWGIDGASEGSQDDQDIADAARMYELLEQEIVPLFYNKATDGIPHGWVQVAKEAVTTILPRFSSERMMREYLETMYKPAAQS